MPAKAELIGHQSLLCVKSHLFVHAFVKAPPLFLQPRSENPPHTHTPTSTPKLHSLNKVLGGDEAGGPADGGTVGAPAVAAAVGDDGSEGPSRSCDFIWGLDELMTALEAKVTLARRCGGGNSHVVPSTLTLRRLLIPRIDPKSLKELWPRAV